MAGEEKVIGDFGKHPAKVESNTWSSILKCPDCGETWIHQEKVEVFYRMGDHKDSPGVRIVVDGGKATSDDSDAAMENNPSWRRDGLLIHFWCELCAGSEAAENPPDDPEAEDYGADGDYAPDRRQGMKTLAIFQHKGQTFLAWEPNPEGGAAR